MRHNTNDASTRRTLVDEQIERCVQFALRGTTPVRSHDERRRLKRHPFPYPVRLSPVDNRGKSCGDTIVVLGKHLTNQGLDFYYQQPVSARRVVASFDCDLDDRIEVLMDLTWCRFSGHGWYENGGRFLTAIQTPTVDQPLSPPLDVPTVLDIATGLNA